MLIQLHELFTYLGQQGVTTFLLVAQHGLVGRDMPVAGRRELLGGYGDSAALLRGAR